MRRRAKDVRRRAKALTDPKPNFVSLVRTGANMTPFLSVKSAEPVAPEPEVEDDFETVSKAADYEVVRIVFKREDYAEESVVKAWLDDGGYEDYEISVTDAGFEVGTIDPADDRQIREITMKGMTVFAAMKTTEDAARAESQGAAVSTVSAIAKKSVDEDRRKSLYTVSELCQLVAYTQYLVNDLSYEVIYGDEEEEPARAGALATLKTAGVALLAALSEIMGVEVAEMAESFKASEPETTEETVAKAEEVVVEAATEEVEAEKAGNGDDVDSETGNAPVEAEKSEEVVEAATEEVEAEKTEEEAPSITEEASVEAKSDQVTDVLSAIKAMAEAMTGLTETMTSFKADVQSRFEQQDERVSAIEGERQSRKGADADEVTTESVKKEEGDVEALRRRSILGMRN